jgi:hypothetical protein
MPETFTAANFRERAEAVRALARQMTGQETREELLEIARQYDKLADHADRRRDRPALSGSENA